MGKTNKINTIKKILKREIMLYTVPARIRHCDGFILEAITVQPQRKLMFELMTELQDKGYNIYSLRHKDGDMSEPHFITSKGILVNRFGWFLTKDKMKFKSETDEIRLTVRNSLYYNDCNGEIISKYFYGSCAFIPINKYFEQADRYK